MDKQITFGLPSMRAEAGERRAFLPDFVAGLERNGARVYLEHGYGAGMGLSEDDYRSAAPGVIFTSHEDTYAQDIVLVLRYPAEDDLRGMRPGACLISMLHFPTRPQRIALLQELGLEALSLDSIKDDNGTRLVENLRSVAWNGAEAAFQVLRQTYPPPGLESPQRRPLHVTLLGSGAVAVHVLQAAIRYGDVALWQQLASQEVPGIQLTAVDYDTTRHEASMLDLLARTDLLVDATQRPDPSCPVIPNAWIAYLPVHAVLLDLSVDPYRCDTDPRFVKGIEGMPQGNLDQYIFPPDDPAFSAIPPCIDTTNRRHSVSCYSWPGVHPRACMRTYGHQLRPIVRTILEKGGISNVYPSGKFFERAIGRGLLSRWTGENLL